MKSAIRSIILFTIIFIAGIFCVPAQTDQPKFEIEGTDGEWFVDRKERRGDAKIADFLGRRSLWLKNNSHVMRTGSDFTDGTIEFDVAPMKGGQFVALLFRRETFRHYENIYFRAHKSGQYNALQYAPAINGSSTWQLYPEFNRTIDFPANQWTRFRVEVAGSRMAVFVGDAETPVLTVPRLRSEAKKGLVAFWARINNQPELWAAAVSNIRITDNKTRKVSDLRETISAPPKGILASWQVAKPFETKEGEIMNIPARLENWQPATAEESGLINLTRTLGSPRGRWTAFAKTSIRADKAKTLRLKFGYSDDVTIFLNGRPVFSGINGWESRYPESMGFVKTGNETVFLNLQPGDNELIFAVTNQRFGWGFIAQIAELKSE